MKTINAFQQGETVLLRYKDGTPALWINKNTAGTSINDVNWSFELSPMDNLDQMIGDWKASVQWDEEIPS